MLSRMIRQACRGSGMRSTSKKAYVPAVGRGPWRSWPKVSNAPHTIAIPAGRGGLIGFDCVLRWAAIARRRALSEIPWP